MLKSIGADERNEDVSKWRNISCLWIPRLKDVGSSQIDTWYTAQFL